MFGPGKLVGFASLGELSEVEAEMAGVGGDKANGAVEVLGVVPADEVFHPRTSGCEIGEGLLWERGAVFEGPEKGLGIRVVCALKGTLTTG